ncbi:sigma-70 family RNA polymerase sigma factor [Actinophytocola sp.]|uniref:RNA polymerase sigma factor n=1 Tax=Actinophytocola sp. TaxID=1872138 RepID=UPI002EDBB0CE
MSALTDPTDAELVAGVLAGDREAFAAVYDRYADRLHDFCWSVLRDRDEAADAVQDTFVLLAQRLAQLTDPDRLRPWLYAVARSVALRKVRARQRVVLDEVGDMADTDPGPDRAAEQGALRELVWSAAAGLSERDRALLDLHVRQGLDGAELGEAMGVSAGHAYVLLTRLRDQVERSLGALLIARQGRADCAGLDALLSDWDGRYSPLMRKRVARHVDLCDVCSSRRRIMVSPFALLAAVPLLPAPVWLRDRVMDEVDLAAYETEPATQVTEAVTPPAAADSFADADDDAEDHVADPPDAAARRRLRIIAAAVAVLALLVAGGAAVYLRNTPVPGEPLGLDVPIGVSTSSSGPSSSAPGSSSSAPPTTTTTPVETTTDRTITTTDSPIVQDPPSPPNPPRDTTPPTIGRAAASPSTINQNAALCDPTTSQVSALVADNVGVASVILSWTGPDGPGSAAMSRNGNQWTGTLGPFPSSGTVSWTIAAADAAGNPAPPTGGRLTVNPCPFIG